jgi:hypothetical protein
LSKKISVELTLIKSKKNEIKTLESVQDEVKEDFIKNICLKVEKPNLVVTKLIIDHISKVQEKTILKTEEILYFLFEKQQHVIDAILILKDYEKPFAHIIGQLPKNKSNSIPIFNDSNQSKEILKRIQLQGISKLSNSILIDRDIDTEGFSLSSHYAESFQNESLEKTKQPPPPMNSPPSEHISGTYGESLNESENFVIQKYLEATKGESITEEFSLDEIGRKSYLTEELNEKYNNL